MKFPTQWEKICSKPPTRWFSMGFLMEQHVESGFNGMIQWFSRTNQLQHLRPWSSDVGASPGVTVYPQHLSCFSLCKLMISGDIFVRYTSDFAISLSGEPPQLGEAFVQQMYIYIYNYIIIPAIFSPRISYQHVPSGFLTVCHGKSLFFNR